MPLSSMWSRHRMAQIRSSTHKANRLVVACATERRRPNESKESANCRRVHKRHVGIQLLMSMWCRSKQSNVSIRGNEFAVELRHTRRNLTTNSALGISETGFRSPKIRRSPERHLGKMACRKAVGNQFGDPRNAARFAIFPPSIEGRHHQCNARLVARRDWPT